MYRQTGLHTITDINDNTGTYDGFDWYISNLMLTIPRDTGTPVDTLIIVNIIDGLNERAFTFDYSLEAGQGKFDMEDFYDMILLRPEFAGSTPI